MKSTLLKVMTNKVTIDLNVLGALMKNIIMGNVNSITIVTVNMSTVGLRSTYVSQDLGANEARGVLRWHRREHGTRLQY